jgi:tetratricopeptide (TPR) repeat protein
MMAEGSTMDKTPARKLTLRQLMNGGRPGDVIERCLTSIEFYEKRFGRDCMPMAAALQWLSCAYRQSGELSKAIEAQREAVEIIARHCAQNDDLRVWSLLALGDLLVGIGQVSDARDRYLEALSAIDEHRNRLPLRQIVLKQLESIQSDQKDSGGST